MAVAVGSVYEEHERRSSSVHGPMQPPRHHARAAGEEALEELKPRRLGRMRRAEPITQLDDDGEAGGGHDTRRVARRQDGAVGHALAEADALAHCTLDVNPNHRVAFSPGCSGSAAFLCALPSRSKGRVGAHKLEKRVLELVRLRALLGGSALL